MGWLFSDALIGDDVRQTFPFLIPFGVIGVWRWTLFAMRVVFWSLYRPIKPRKKDDGSSANRYHSERDVTIIVPTIDNGPEFQLAAKYWLMNCPHEIIVVTSDAKREEMEDTCRIIDPNMFRVLSVPKPNKRVQMVLGVNAATTDIVALSDDDAIWTEQFLDWCLAPFDDRAMGGVGSKQIMIPVDSSRVSFWEVIADFRLTMRMIEASASTYLDGGMSCISGRTAIYRRQILADPVFQQAFVNETWRGKYALHSGDDKFITRWLVTHEWNMQMQNHKEACLQTTFKNNSDFLKQVLRWTRNTWRSDFKSIFVDKKILWRHPYVAFNMFDKFINPLPMLWGLSVIVANLITNGSGTITYVVLPILSWLILSRTCRLLPHVIRRPSHLPYVPMMILFQYYFVFAKVYALFTLHITDWGSRSTSAANTTDVVELADENEFDGKDLADPEEMVTNGRLLLEWSTDHMEVVLADKKDMEAASATTASDRFSDDESYFASVNAMPKKIVPWYKRPTVVIGWLTLSTLLFGMVNLGFTAARHRFTDWEMTLVSSSKSLSSDSATSGGVYDKQSDTTFIAYAGPNMDPVVLAYDHAKNFIATEQTVATTQPNSDYHDFPKIIMANDGRLLVIYTDSPETLFQSKCNQPHTSAGKWTNQVINHDGATHPCPIKSSTGDIYIFYRSVQAIDYRPLHYTKSTDHGQTWSDPQIAIDTGGHSALNLNEVYADCPRLEPATGNTPERFSMGWTMAGGGPLSNIHNHYHKDAHFAYFLPGSDTFADVKGHDLGSSIELEELETQTIMFDSGPLDEDEKHIVDIYFAPSYSSSNCDEPVGCSPLVVFNVKQTLVSARWTGYSWDYSLILQDAAYNLFDIQKTGEQSFRVFHAQDSILIFSTNDGGKTWKRDRQVETPSGGSVSKVMTIADAHPDMSLLAHENDWSQYFDADTPDESNYVGSYKVWTARWVEYNPIASEQRGPVRGIDEPTTSTWWW